MIIWLTGQPGSGKTTLAGWLQSHFHKNAVIIDGDDIRDIYQNKDYSEEGRKKNVEMAQNIALFLHNKNFTPIVSMVSPYREQRESFKEKLGTDIKEIFVHTTEIRGKEQFFVENYEPPIDNFTDIDTTNNSEYHTFLNLRRKLNI